MQLVEPARAQSGRCEFAQATARVADTADADRIIRDRGVAILARYGLRLDPATCMALDSRIGQQSHPYQWCRAVPAHS
ncbi:hypothetical protein H1235_11615 [Pseudoxanthomonas sp. NC8]|nr:hypothetical protein H1235_11615 [Pseudoxanthomonas sp. NC8]